MLFLQLYLARQLLCAVALWHRLTVTCYLAEVDLHDVPKDGLATDFGHWRGLSGSLRRCWFQDHRQDSRL